MDRMRPVRRGQRAVAKPRRLPLGVLARHQLRPPRRLGKRDLAPQMRRQFRHAMRAHRRQGGVQLQRQQRPHLVERARSEHGGEPRRNRRAQRLARRIEQDRRKPPRRRRRRPGRLPCREPPAGAAPHLPGARDALAVARPQPRGRRLIDFCQRRVQRRRPVLRQHSSRFRPRCIAALGNVGESLGQRGEIEAGAAAQDRQSFRRPRRSHLGQRRAAPPRGTARLRRRRARRTGDAAPAPPPPASAAR